VTWAGFLEMKHPAASSLCSATPASSSESGAEAAGEDSCALVEELAPTPDPAETFRRLAGLAHPLFLDSSLRHHCLGRYSFLSADPFEWICSRGNRTVVSSENRSREPANPFTILSERLGRFRLKPTPGLPPFQGGAAGMFGYDLCHHLERLPRARFDEFEVPDLAVGLYDWVVAFDHSLNRAWLISTGFPETEPTRRRRHAQRRADMVKRWLEKPPARRLPRQHRPTQLMGIQYPVHEVTGLTSNFSRGTYLDAARKAIEYIHAGDCFQVNLSQRLLYPAEVAADELYLRLRERNPSTFAGYLDLGEFVIASASPERFLAVRDGEVETRPIKGTRPRGDTQGEDEACRQELLESAKDRAENIMIVDLLRNDLGRVCRYGSVRVPALCRLESYRYVHHLVSEVRGRLRKGLGPVDLLGAAFPGGSVTGAPKIRAMQIIAELNLTSAGRIVAAWLISALTAPWIRAS